MSDVIDYALEDYVDLDTPERMKAVADPVRSLILDLVLERALTVTELAARTGKSKGTVAHHVDVLVECGLLKVVRVRKVRATEERSYGRTARTIVYHHHDADGLPFFAEAQTEADRELMDREDVPGGFTLRHARVPFARAAEWSERLQELALEFSREPRDGDVEFAVLVAVYPTKRPVAPTRGKGRSR